MCVCSMLASRGASCVSSGRSHAGDCSCVYAQCLLLGELPVFPLAGAMLVTAHVCMLNAWF